MKAVIQRVSAASVTVDDRVIGRIGPGLLVLLGIERGDGNAEAGLLAAKVARLRIFADDAGKMNRAVLDTKGGVLVVSQFTLAADLSRGNRPSFANALAPAEAEGLYRRFVATLASQGVPVETGAFGAHMAVSLVNDGPVTIWIDSRTWLP
jgi:D-tyrosyl-tRNA(Tyr) deacylase